ncbi:hypothetical protein C7S16_3246 [Burkholderia thailandensis]|uniref:Uncharacterized protein n=1 Tax=Burkholderia thailandensis TaxID=57975 RepID=A0AAW9CWP1_BURTH|nr:hypothetical protein [Burkholderia thailandensis]
MRAFKRFAIAMLAAPLATGRRLARRTRASARAEAARRRVHCRQWRGGPRLRASPAGTGAPGGARR